jgi:hypothetical protein
MSYRDAHDVSLKLTGLSNSWQSRIIFQLIEERPPHGVEFMWFIKLLFAMRWQIRSSEVSGRKEHDDHYEPVVSRRRVQCFTNIPDRQRAVTRGKCRFELLSRSYKCMYVDEPKQTSDRRSCDKCTSLKSNHLVADLKQGQSRKLKYQKHDRYTHFEVVG